MGDKSGIEWTEATWNPVTGCSKVSPGCAHCYAETLTRRFATTWGVPDLPWTPANAEANVILHPERLNVPLRWKRPRMIFVNSMSDLFHEEIDPDFVAQVFGVMRAARRHTFQVLTKRPERMREFLADAEFVHRVCDLAETYAEDGLSAREREAIHDDLTANVPWPLPNVWLGTSIENRRYVGRADELRATPATLRFISAEPLLGPLVYDDGTSHEMWNDPESSDYTEHWSDTYTGPSLDLTGIDWLIVGGESGPGHRPMREDWVRDLRSLCAATRPDRWPGPPEPGDDAVGTAFFFKQWGGARPKANGRELDGRTWDEMPAARVIRSASYPS